MGLPLAARIRYDSGVVTRNTADDQPGMVQDPDADLVAKAQAGDVQAFETLVVKYRNEVMAMSYHFVRNREEAWDLSQEAFVKAYRAMERFRSESGFKTWLLRITANHCKDYLKKRRLDTVPFDEALKADGPAPALGPDRAMAASELGQAIDDAVAALPPKLKLAFTLREYQDLSYEEMAHVMECRIGTVMSRLFNARKKLQQALRERGVVEDMDHV